MNSESIIALTAVIVTGTVSIFGVMLPAYLEWRKSRWQRAFVEIERIHEKAGNLSLSLAKFRNPAYLKEKGIDLEERINLRANHDAWEMAIFLQLEKNERDKIREMRKNSYGWNYLTGKDEEGEANVMKLIDNVIELSAFAIEKLNNDAARWNP